MMSEIENNYSKFNSLKIRSEKQLSSIIKNYKSRGKTVGLCVGSYDLLHPGHMKHFESAKKLCDVLVVAVTADKFVRKRKGPERPVISEHLRAYAISQLESVGYVMISPYNRATNIIKSLKPTYYVKGSDYKNKQTPGITAERKAITGVGGEIKYTYDEKFSTTDLIRQIQKKTDKPVLAIGAGLAGVGKSAILSEFAKKQNFMYIDREDIDTSFLSIIKNGRIINNIKARDASQYRSSVKYQTYIAMLKLAKQNLRNGFNVVLDGYFADKLDPPFIKNILRQLSDDFYVVKIYFTASKKTIWQRMKERYSIRDKEKMESFESYFQKHKNDDLSQFDIVFNTEGDLLVNVDSLSHEIMNVVYGE